ncbi:hypothetical protein CC1G_04790 [Coprinopsis cinerea okayama7|uniref:Uncharacterized protein n=1 Tax=Coprinopsis cinerea (strain Okayama-7 / 130 / ATCC MYA-4618 / FGSC 9003) TaxID=240176 RepID=A8P2K7_COPC7|nr:hypothetical protein CC1G_04790 [Coprinopsis cinerea okayama7\|eukprot:XP_001838346.1 hypothetical protein CC1G_04790 [Coprinopsis cinerea okayama7\
MYISTIARVALGIFPVLLATIQPSVAQAPSPTPNCWVCPDEDYAGFVLTESLVMGDSLRCVYGDPWYCDYNRNDGSLTVDQDEGLCYSAAVHDCAARRRRALPRAPHPPSPGSQEPKPEVMHTRARLGGKKRQKSRIISYYD